MPQVSEVRTAVYIGAAKYSIFPLVVLAYIWFEPVTAPGFALGPLAMFYLLLAGRWDLVGHPLRFIFLALLIIFVGERAGWWPAAAVFVCLAALAALLHRPAAGQILDLAFPLRGGWYSVAQGGSSGFLNRHRASRSQRFALDIVALNFAGARAFGIFPRRLTAYRIFGRSVCSPCSGTVTSTVGDLPDVPPGRMDPANPAGNHVVIQDAAGICVGLGHLMRGSISVRPGDCVEPGQMLARVGNSGYSSEPHLHVHAKRGGDPRSMLDGDAVPVRFRGRWLVRNSLVRA